MRSMVAEVGSRLPRQCLATPRRPYTFSYLNVLVATQTACIALVATVDDNATQPLQGIHLENTPLSHPSPMSPSLTSFSIVVTVKGPLWRSPRRRHHLELHVQLGHFPHALRLPSFLSAQNKMLMLWSITPLQN